MPAKKAFLNQFVTELRHNCLRDVGGSLDELEGRLGSADGWVLLGVFRTGGMMGDKIDGLIRFQPGFLGLECGKIAGFASLRARAKARVQLEGGGCWKRQEGQGERQDTRCFPEEGGAGRARSLGPLAVV